MRFHDNCMEPLPGGENARTITVNCIAFTARRQAQLAVRTRSDPSLQLRFSAAVLPPGAASAYIIPSDRMETVLSQHASFGLLPVFPFGPSRHIERAFSLGARDYLREPWSYEELKARIFHNLSAPFLTVPTTGARIDFRPGSLIGPGGRILLSEEQTRIMRVLLAVPGTPAFREALHIALWGRFKPGSRALDMHISALRKKIRTAGGLDPFDPRHDPIEALRRIGYRIAASFYT